MYNRYNVADVSWLDWTYYMYDRYNVADASWLDWAYYMYDVADASWLEYHGSHDGTAIKC